jgi:hypothetical protein
LQARLLYYAKIEAVMPANLPPQYFEAEKRFREAKSSEEKIEALEIMLAIMPKHKGTDHLQADLRRRISKLNEESERMLATSRASFYIRKEGAGQVALVGLANVGKSQLLEMLTDATPEVGDYPFTTKSPTVGMMKFENIQIQVVDTPAVNGREARTWVNNIARNADLLALVVDLSNKPVEQVKATLQALEGMGIIPDTDVVDESTIGRCQKKIVIVGNKRDMENTSASAEQLRSRYGSRFPIAISSAIDSDSLAELEKMLFKGLDIIRIHTKTPGKKPDLNDPMIMKAGSTAREAAEAVHKEFKAKLKYAVVWGSGKFDGQRVSQEHILQDNDIVELHI